MGHFIGIRSSSHQPSQQWQPIWSRFIIIIIIIIIITIVVTIIINFIIININYCYTAIINVLIN